MNGQPPYAPMTPQPPIKKGLSGCVIAALVVGALGLVGLVVVGVVFVKVFSSFTPDESSQLGAEISESMIAGSGPAADALRSDGCYGVDVVDVKTMPALTKSFIDAGPTDPKPVETVLVDCRPDATSTETFTCERVAKVYLKAAGPIGAPFRVMVHKQHGQPPVCSELRAPDGTLLP